jgi:hypothetical protein
LHASTSTQASLVLLMEMHLVLRLVLCASTQTSVVLILNADDHVKWRHCEQASCTVESLMLIRHHVMLILKTVD